MLIVARSGSFVVEVQVVDALQQFVVFQTPPPTEPRYATMRSEEHTSELQSLPSFPTRRSSDLVARSGSFVVEVQVVDALQQFVVFQTPPPTEPRYATM